MSENPYQSPTDGARARWLRPWRVFFVVSAFLAAVAGPIIWQAAREKVARDRAIRNLQQLRQALEQYQAREPRRPLDAKDPEP